MNDVQTGETFTMNGYSGKVVLLETMAKSTTSNTASRMQQHSKKPWNHFC